MNLVFFISFHFLNFQSFAKPVVNKSRGEPEDMVMEDFAVQSVEKVPDMVEVVCGNKCHLIPVDKLAAKSQFFARAFEVPMAEKRERKVVLKDFDEKVFEKVVMYIVEDLFLFDMQTEAGEALEAADRLDVKELKDDVCSIIKDNLDLENVKAVLSLADKFNAKELFQAAFEYMQDNEIKFEEHEIVENPGLALAFMKEGGAMIKALKKDLSIQKLRLEETEERVEYYKSEAYGSNAWGLRNYYDSDSYDYDEDYHEQDWHIWHDVEEDDDNEDDTQLANAEVEAYIEGVRSGFDAAHRLEDEDGKETDGKAEEEEKGIHEAEQDSFSYLSSSDTKKEEEETQK